MDLFTEKKRTNRQNDLISKSVGFFLVLLGIFVKNLKAILYKLLCHNENVNRQICGDGQTDEHTDEKTIG